MTVPNPAFECGACILPCDYENGGGRRMEWEKVNN